MGVVVGGGITLSSQLPNSHNFFHCIVNIQTVSGIDLSDFIRFPDVSVSAYGE